MRVANKLRAQYRYAVAMGAKFKKMLHLDRDRVRGGSGGAIAPASFSLGWFLIATNL